VNGAYPPDVLAHAAPLPNPSSPVLAVKGAPPGYALFSSAGKFSFDDVRNVAADGRSIWLATAGGVVQGVVQGAPVASPAGDALLRTTQLFIGDLCGPPDGIRIEQDRPFVGYGGRTTGQFMAEPCTSMQPWQLPHHITMPGDNALLTVALSGSTLTGQFGSIPVFRFTRTDQVFWLFGSWMQMDEAKLIDVIDDGDRAWLVFEDNLVILRKGELWRHREG
jgi:hypothetical protein